MNTEEIQDIIDNWNNEVGGISSSHIMTKNEHYQKLIAIGHPAIPLILKNLK